MPFGAGRLNPVAGGLLVVGTAAAVAGAESVGGPEMRERAGDLAAGLALLVGGAVSWKRRPRAGAGPLMVVTGLAWTEPA